MPRNRVRNELLPLLRRHYQPALTRTVLRLMEIVGAEADLAGETARQWLEIGCRSRGLPGRSSGAKTGDEAQNKRAQKKTGYQLEPPHVGCYDFAGLPVAVQRRVLQLQLSEIGVPADFELIESLRQSAGVPVSLGPEFSVVRDADGAISLCPARPAGFNAGETDIPLAGRAGEVIFDGVRVRWRFDTIKKFKRPAARPACEFFDADKIGGRILLRHWRPGDRFQPIGLKSAVKLQDLFTNRKIPRARRRELLVAATAADEIFWVENLRMGEHFKLTPRTKRRLVWRWRR
jgi:tRNA(Ile)-lysidine synthase